MTTAGDSDGGGRVRGDGSICTEEAEYGCPVHCNPANSGPLQGDSDEVSGVGF